MNRFSTADKLNKSSGIYNLKNANSYTQQLLDVIALQQKQNNENGSTFTPNSVAEPPAQFAVAVPAASPPSELSEFSNGNMKSKHFGNGDGELDMLFGFFIMNGACIVFFLLFGVCVICNCAARKPKFHGSEEKKKKPTVGRLVAAIAPGGFASKAKAKDSTAEKVEENGGNTPLLFSEKQNSDNSNKSNARSTGRSFKSLVARAIAASRGEVPEGATDVERQQPSAALGTTDTASGGRASPPSVATAIAPGALPDRPSAQQCSPSASRRPSGASSRRRPSGASSRRPSGATCCSMTTSAECGCCPVHVVEVPVEVHHLCPQQQHHHQQQHILLDTAPTPLLISNGSSYKSLLPSNQQQQQQQQQPSDLSSHKRCTITPTRSMPSDLCKAAQQQQKTHYHKVNAQNQQLISRAHRRQQVQSVRLNHCGDFAVMKRADWAQLNLQAPSCHHHQPITTHPARHRCSLVVPVACECREMEEEEEDEGEEGEEEPKQHKQEEGGSQEKQSEPGDQFSVVRQNLLGPLSFDDLYYM